MKLNVKLFDCIDAIGPQIAATGEQADATDQFACENYELLAEHGIFSAMVPAEYGGAGLSYADMAPLLTRLAAFHPSTALSLSMHQHIVAANVYKD